MNLLKKNFGARIREIRKSKNLTQEQLAEMIGLDIPNLSNIERGIRFVTSDTLEKIARALEVEEKDLFDFKHLKTKEELIGHINNVLNSSTYDDIKFFYRIIKMYSEI